MGEYVRKSDSVDIMMLAEGTYPFIKGGVSSWISQIIHGLPHYKFGIIFIGSRKEDYKKGIVYNLPNNLVHLEVHYMFGNKEPSEIKKRGKIDKESLEKIQGLHKWFQNSTIQIPKELRDINFYTNELSEKKFLYSKESWDFITEKYQKNCKELPFVDYFWTIRNIHKPIWILTKLVKDLPKMKLLHAPSTGYAGFLGALISYNQNLPFILTEHGIYIRERKIDMLTADWIDFHRPSIMTDYDEYNHIKQIWVSFFEKIGKFCYTRANPIFSLFNGAREIQASFGADIKRTKSVPNGVNVELLKECIAKRDEKTPQVITLIGRVVSIKDIKTFIRAIKTTTSTLPNVQGWIVGPMDEDEDYANECKDMVQTMDLEENVKFLGFQKITDILPESGITTLTSISEGMPLTILEGFAAGVPCVATDVGCCRDLIEGGLTEEDKEIGKAGFITQIANPTDLAKRYIQLLTNQELFNKCQASAIKRVNKFYTQKQLLENYDNEYKKFLK